LRSGRPRQLPRGPLRRLCDIKRLDLTGRSRACRTWSSSAPPYCEAMKILFLAPQPFFQERGTPIAVRLAVEVLGGRKGDSIDLLTYHEGSDVPLKNVRHLRITLPERLPKFLRFLCSGI